MFFFIILAPGVPVLEWVNTSTLSELFSAVNKLSRLFNITCNSFAVSDNNIDYMTSAKFWRFTDRALSACIK